VTPRPTILSSRLNQDYEAGNFLQNSDISAGRPGTGTLYIVATPLGNLDDISRRARDTLQAVELIAAEDTRHSRALLEHFGIRTPLVAYHDHSSAQAAARLLSRLAAGDSVALISDAGTPLISDPGFRLVRQAREAGYGVIPVPGPAALIAALSVAGLPTDRFAFEGFPPAKAAARRQAFARLARETRTLVFYESSHRIGDCLADMGAAFGGEREVFLGRELTKRFETHFFGSLGACRGWLADDAMQRKGEFVLVLAGAAEQSAALERALAMVAVLREELSLRKAVALGARLSGVRKNALYEAALAAGQAPGDE